MLRLLTLGSIRLDPSDSRGLTTPRKQVALLTYLARRAPRPVSRAELADLLWGDRNESRARQSLRQALLELKRVVGDGLVLEPELVSLRRGAVSLDVDEFEMDLAAGRPRQAVERWSGDFLARAEDIGGERFRAWLESERERLRQRLRAAFASLVEEARIRGAWKEGIGWAEEWVAAMPLEQAGRLELIQLLHLDGRTEEALARCSEFRSELGVEQNTELSHELIGLEQRLARSARRNLPARSPGSAALFTPDLIGRGPAMAELRSIWESVRNGAAAVTLVEGEAGIGKTRLCEEFLRRLEDDESDSAIILRARAHESDHASEWRVISDLATGLAAAPGLAGASARALAELAFLSPAVGDRFPDLPHPAISVLALGRSFAAGLEAVAEERPVVAHVDDLPWADLHSQGALQVLAERLPPRAFLLMTARTGDQAPSQEVAQLLSRSRVTRLKLQPLSLANVEALLESMLPLEGLQRRDLARRLHAEGGGNPLFTVEITAAMVDEGVLTLRDTGEWHLAAEGSGLPVPLPASIREVVTRRLTRLAPEVRTTAEAAAVLGHSFDPGLVAPVARLSASATTVALEELLSRRLIRDAPGSPGLFEFTHDITRRVVYDLLPGARREAMHRAAAGAWERKAGTAARAGGVLVHHRVLGGLPGTPTWMESVLRHCRRAFLPKPLALAGLLLVGVAGAIVLWKRPALDPNRVVVAPLLNQTGDSTLDLLGRLAADRVTEGLAATGLVQVVNPRTMLTSAGRVTSGVAPSDSMGTIRALGEETGAGTVVWGVYYRDGDSLEFHVRVSDAARGQVRQTVGPVRGALKDPSSAVEVLRERTVGAVALTHDPRLGELAARASRPPTYEAYRLFAEGMNLLPRYQYTAALDRFARALESDSTFIHARLWSAMTYVSIPDYRRADSVLQRIELLSGQLSPTDRLFFQSLAMSVTGDWARALSVARELQRVASGPESAMMVAQEALKLNRPREAAEALEGIDPTRGYLRDWDGYYAYSVVALHLAGRDGAAREAAREGRRRFPDSQQTLLYEAYILAAIGRTEELEALQTHNASLAPSEIRGPGELEAVAAAEFRAHGNRAIALRTCDEGIRQLEAAGPPQRLRTRAILVTLNYLGEHWDEADTLVAQLAAEFPDSIEWRGYTGVLAARRGDHSTAEQISSELGQRQIPYSHGISSLWRARIAAVLGQRETSVALLRKALAEGLRHYPRIHTIIDFESLASYEPYRQLMRPRG